MTERDCHCLCGLNHPEEIFPGWCQGEAAGPLAFRLPDETVEQSGLLSLDVRMCPACLRATLRRISGQA